MKNNKIEMKEMLMPSLLLMAICLVVTLSLVGTYHITLPIINEALERRGEEARQMVLPEAEGFQLLFSTEEDPNSRLKGVNEVYIAENQAGYVIISEDKGYGGTIKIITGFGVEGTIENLDILEQSETPGLGTRVGNEDFLSQFRGKESLDQVETISGATISSKAMIRAVQSAINQMDTIKKEGV